MHNHNIIVLRYCYFIIRYFYINFRKWFVNDPLIFHGYKAQKQDKEKVVADICPTKWFYLSFTTLLWTHFLLFHSMSETILSFVIYKHCHVHRYKIHITIRTMVRKWSINAQIFIKWIPFWLYIRKGKQTLFGLKFHSLRFEQKCFILIK